MGDDVRRAGMSLAARELRERQRRPREAYFGLVYAVTVMIVEAQRLGEPSRVIASGALAAMVPWYVLAVRPLLLRQAECPQTSASIRGSAFMAVLVGLFAVVQSQSTSEWSMRDRARQAGGSLEVSTAPGAGTVVRAVVPG